MTKRVDIEALLRWAYRDELPKDQLSTAFLRPQAFGEPWGSVTKTGMLGTEIQEPSICNRYGMAPDFTAFGQPHADATLLWAYVQALDDATITIPEDWNPIADLGDLAHYGEVATAKAIDRLCFHVTPPPKAESTTFRSARIRRQAADGTMKLRVPISETIHKYAVLGKGPEWKADKPTFCTVKTKEGQSRWFIREEIVIHGETIIREADGFDRKRRVPKPEAYLKHYYDPDPAKTAEARGEYEIWHAALSALADDVAGRLIDHEPLTPARAARPWEEPEIHMPRIIMDLRPQPVIAKVERPWAGPPPFRGIDRSLIGRQQKIPNEA